MAKAWDGKVHQPDDKVLKALLQSKKAFMQLLRYFLSEDWAKHIEEHSLLRIDKSFILQDFAGKEADILYRCRLDGQEVVFYVLLELQSTVDQQMPWRLLQYMVEIWRSLLKDEDDARKRTQGFRLPAVIPIVLYNGSPVWTAKLNFREYQDRHELFDHCLLDFKYMLVDVKRWDTEKLKTFGGVLPLALRLDDSKNSLDLLTRLESSMDALSQLSEDEVGLIQSYLLRILAPMVKGTAKEAVQRWAKDLTGGPDMISNAAVNIRRAYNRQMKLERQEGRQEGRQEIQQSIIGSMHQRGMSADEISDLTKVPLELVLETLKSCMQ